MSGSKTGGRSPILEELLAHPETHARELATAIVDESISTPVSSLVDPGELARAWAEGLRSTAAREDLESWLEERAARVLDLAHDRFDGTVHEHLAPEVEASIERVIGSPYRADPRLLRSVLRHRRVRSMLGEGLRGLLTDFGKSLIAVMPGGTRAGALAGIMDVAKNMASMVRAELDRQLEGRVRDFVDETLDRGIDKWTSSLGGKERAKRSAETRVELLGVMLEQEVRDFIAIPKAADVAWIASVAAEEIRALAGWDGLEDEIEKALRLSLEPFGDETIEEFLEGSGLLESWRPAIESLLAGRLTQLFASEPFGMWLTNLENGIDAADEKPATKKKGSTKKKAAKKKA